MSVHPVTVGLGWGMMDPGFWIQDSGARIQGPGFSTQDSASRILDPIDSSRCLFKTTGWGLAHGPYVFQRSVFKDLFSDICFAWSSTLCII